MNTTNDEYLAELERRKKGFANGETYVAELDDDEPTEDDDEGGGQEPWANPVQFNDYDMPSRRWVPRKMLPFRYPTLGQVTQRRRSAMRKSRICWGICWSG